MSIGDRLKRERERLGLTIPEFAELAGAKKNTVIDWQNDTSSPPAAKLEALAKGGVDALFIVTGRRARASKFDESVNSDLQEKRCGETNTCGNLDATRETWTSRPSSRAELGRESQPARLDQATLRRALKVVLAAVRAEGVEVSVDGLARVVVLIYQLMLARQSAADIAAHVQRLIDEAIHAGD